ncbi:MAG: hypothetical protein DCC71_24975 [Proteobacteria bacterium]|nr:MAG: hypothetical protein DCC71_24975 [Pseudomonadota bacterium]
MSEDVQQPDAAADTPELAAAEAKPSLRPLVVLDADPAERARVEAAASEIGRPVQTLAPGALIAERLEEIAGAAALVVAWDLDGRAGLDVVDAIARRRDAKPLRIAMSATAATRAMVAAAVRAGATSFLSRPYDVDELRHLVEELP